MGVPDHSNYDWLIIVRHGRIVSPIEPVFTGWQDTPLSLDGIDDTRRAATTINLLLNRLAAVHDTCVISSDLLRTRMTAEALAARLHVQVILDHRLREEYLGDWEGLIEAEVETLFPVGYREWLAGRSDEFSGREGLDAVASRALQALDDIRSTSSPHAILIVVTHANTIHAILGRLLGIDRRAWVSIPSLPPGGVSLIYRTPGNHRWTLPSYSIFDQGNW